METKLKPFDLEAAKAGAKDEEFIATAKVEWEEQQWTN